ncbi:MAG: choice-of-anchor Q domain-containing protein, partial [Nitriliruptorales bacterium]|nr:choice-of-anchor Q domain-containing protein [Nitriliruptorales bacterium]
MTHDVLRRPFSLAMALALALSIVAGVPPFAVQEANAATVVVIVDAVYDAPDNDLGDGICGDLSGNCTLRAAIDQMNAGTWDGDDVIIEMVHGGLGTHTVSAGQLVVDSGPLSLTIRSQTPGSRSIIDLGDTSRLFTLNGGANVTLIDMDIRNGAAAAAGGCINNSANLTLFNVRLFSCDSTGGFPPLGGALMHNAGQLIVQNGDFDGNHSNGLGGAIVNFSTGTQISSTVFQNNTAQTRGGAIHAQASWDFISGSTFLNNHSLAGDGGAISTFVHSPINNTGFNSNSAAISGGAIYTESQLPMNNVTFIENDADFGGAIYASGSMLDITTAVFRDNTATSSGGAIHHVGGAGWSIVDAEFDGNHNFGPGATAGAAHFTNPGTIQNALFVGNATDGDGGALYFEEGATPGFVDVQDATFINNDSFSGNGGAVALSNLADVFLTRTGFQGNDAFNGGAIATGTQAALGLASSTVSFNTATNGGGFHLGSQSTTQTVFSTLVDNTGGNGPGLYSAVDATASFWMRASVQGGNTSVLSSDDVCNGTDISSRGSNVLEQVFGCTVNPSTGPADTLNLTPGTLDLDNNGPLRPPAFTSPVYEAIAAGTCAQHVTDALTDIIQLDAATDQRGTARPQGTNCEAGAFEAPTSPITFVVDENSYDNNVASPFVCETSSGGCSPKAAVDAANGLLGWDVTILLEDNTNYLMSGPADELVLNGTANSVTFRTPGGVGNEATLSGSGVSRVLNIQSGTSVMLEDVIVNTGSANSSGGCILNQDVLTIVRGVVGACQANGATSDGGGIHNLGVVTLDHSKVVTSSAGRDGGGIHNLGQLTIINDPNELAGDISF